MDSDVERPSIHVRPNREQVNYCMDVLLYVSKFALNRAMIQCAFVYNQIHYRKQHIFLCLWCLTKQKTKQLRHLRQTNKLCREQDTL